jgi:hypothetical protein
LNIINDDLRRNCKPLANIAHFCLHRNPGSEKGSLMGQLELYPYNQEWSADDPHANFKAEVAVYSRPDPLPTLENLSRATGVPVPCLVRYVLVKYASSGADALLAMQPIVLQQMEGRIAEAERIGTEEARLEAYQALRQMISWLALGLAAR